MPVPIDKAVSANSKLDDEKPTQVAPRKHVIYYLPIITLLYFHVAGAYGLYLSFTTAKWSTLIFAFFLYLLGELGITAGAHRLWSHKSYKARMPLQVLLMIFNTLSFQGTVIYWARDHRLHHKYSDTDWDPHNAQRGFFFSHVGWLITKKSKDLIEQGKKIDMSDLQSNPVLKFQEKYATPFVEIVCFILPSIIPVYFWEESLFTAWHVNVFRYVVNLHVSLSINSFAHMFGYKPYDKNILPSNNLVLNLGALGDGFHNYHHAFPWDYQSGELGNKVYNITALFIDFCALIGLAYDLKKESREVVVIRKKRDGDGTDLWGRNVRGFIKKGM